MVLNFGRIAHRPSQAQAKEPARQTPRSSAPSMPRWRGVAPTMSPCHHDTCLTSWPARGEVGRRRGSRATHSLQERARRMSSQHASAEPTCEIQRTEPSLPRAALASAWPPWSSSTRRRALHRPRSAGECGQGRRPGLRHEDCATGAVSLGFGQTDSFGPSARGLGAINNQGRTALRNLDVVDRLIQT